MTISFYLVQDDKDIQLLTDIAQEIWHEYFPCIISDAQIEYMIEQYQSVSALTKQIKDGGYCYQILYCDDIPAGYFGVCMQDDGSLFLSKLYLKQQFRPSLPLKKEKERAKSNQKWRKSVKSGVE